MNLGVKVGDVLITRVSLHNAKFVRENGIGPGARLLIRRSGDVIPYVHKVVKPVKPSSPDPKQVGEFTLDPRGTNYILSKPQDNDEFRIQRLLKFFGTLEVDFIKVGTIRKMYDLGMKNVKSWVNATPRKLVSLGLTEATATKLYESLNAKIGQGVPLVTLMDASGTFPHGLGKTRFEKIQESYDLEALLTKSPDEQRDILSTIPGFGVSVTEGFVKGAPKFMRWIDVVGIDYTKPKREKPVKGPLNGVNVSWTGYRNKEEESLVTENGGQVVPFGGKTSILLVSPTGKASSKTDKAAEKGIPVLTWDRFRRKYKL